jgi:two-component system CheB/CheR fusion protein
MCDPVSRERDTSFEALLDHLRRTRGIDLSGYKRSSLSRRVSRRLRLVGAGGYRDYVDYLEKHPEEFALLFDTILINVTSFFRDRPAWEYLRDEIIPRLLEAKRPGDPMRVWSAGCASGEEAFSLGIAMAEAPGRERFRGQITIHASDIDEGALAQARAAAYRARDLEAVPREWRAKYFVPRDGRWIVRLELRRRIIFGRHDLVQDAPIPRLDLLACRNTLIYFNTETQASILARFHSALTDTGFLVLGEAETLIAHGGLFIAEDSGHRVFRKATGERKTEH